MPLANDLLEQAYHLAKREPKRPRQASLRRAVSSSYYALFHLLVSEATRNWKQAHQRPALGRYFEHGKMANASNKQKGDCNKFINSSPAPAHTPDDIPEISPDKLRDGGQSCRSRLTKLTPQPTNS